MFKKINGLNPEAGFKWSVPRLTICPVGTDSLIKGLHLCVDQGLGVFFYVFRSSLVDSCSFLDRIDGFLVACSGNYIVLLSLSKVLNFREYVLFLWGFWLLQIQVWDLVVLGENRKALLVQSF